MKYYVYTYKDPTDMKIFYVGKGTGSRSFSHLKRREKNMSLHNDQLALKIDKILEEGNVPIIEIEQYFDDEACALTREMQLIEEIGLDSLTNKINTQWPPIMPDDVISKRANTCKNNPKWRETMKSKEHREKLSIAVKQAILERGGRPPLSAEHRAAVSRGCKGKLVGEKNPSSKNNPEQIIRYLEAIMNGAHWKRTAVEMGISNAFNVMHRRAWSHVPAPDGYVPPTVKKSKGKKKK